MYVLPSATSLTGKPFAKVIVMSVGFSGALIGSFVRVHISAGGETDGSSSMPA